MSLSQKQIREIKILSELTSGRNQSIVIAEYGDVARKLIAKGHWMLDTANVTNGKANFWKDWEIEHVGRYIGVRDIAVIAADLGRTVVAVRLKVRRHPDLFCPTKRNGCMNARRVGFLLGKDGKEIGQMVERGIIPGYVIPGMTIYSIPTKGLKAWMLNPENWIYFDMERVTDPILKHILLIRRANWGDEWWKIGKVCDYHHLVNSTPVNNRIRDGKVPSARRWGNWYMKKSDALNLHFFDNWKIRTITQKNAQRFSILAYSAGVPTERIAEMLGIRAISARSFFQGMAQCPTRQKNMLADHKLEYLGETDTGRLYTPWWLHKEKFRFIGKSVARFLRGPDCALITDEDRFLVRSIMVRYAEAHFGTGHKLCTRLHCLSATSRLLHERYADFLELGIDPLGEC